MPSSPSLTLGGKIVLGAGALFLISTFLPWYTVSVKALGTSQSDSANAWHFALPKIAALLVLVLLAEVIVTQVANVKLPTTPPGAWNLGRLALSGLAALLVLIELIKGQDSGLDDAKAAASVLSGLGGTGDLGFDLSIGRGIGMFLGVIVVLALVAGTFLRLKETPAQVTSGDRPQTPWGQHREPGATGQTDPTDLPTYGSPNQAGQPGEGQ
jgi:hypothetical protein